MSENPSRPSQPVRVLKSADRSRVAAAIRTEMANRGLTQVKLSELTAYDERTIRNVLKGLPVRDRTLYEICASLELKPPPFGGERLDGRRSIRGDIASVAVLPFSNLSTEPSQEYFVDGLVDDIITELSRFSELLVIARNSTFQFKGTTFDVRRIGRELGAYYVVEGSVRRSTTRVRVTARLIDAQAGTNLWADTYDRELDDVFAVQTGIARAIVSALAVQVTRAEESRTQAKLPEDWQAYDYYLQGARLLGTYPSVIDIGRIIGARRLLEKALEIDPNYARAHAVLSATHIATWISPIDGNRLKPSELNRALEFAQTAVQLDSYLPQARAQLGNVLLFKREHDASLAQFARAVDLNPNYCDWRWPASVMLSGEPLRAIEILEQQTLRDPFHEPRALLCLGLAHFLAQQFPEAAIPQREAVLRAPDYLPAHVHLAATCFQLGELSEAHHHAQEVLRLEPGWMISSRLKRALPFRRSSDLELYAESLRQVGLPE